LFERAQRVENTLSSLSSYFTALVVIVGYRKYANKSCPGEKFDLGTLRNIVKRLS
jgi:hypothetical protein